MYRTILLLFLMGVLYQLGLSLWIALLIAGLAALLMYVPVLIARNVEKKSNATLQQPPYHASEAATAVHQGKFMVDLHADPLLWNRNLLKRHDYGHVDLPRLEEGNVALQVCGLVTKSPKGQNFERNEVNSFDNITLLAMLQGWPIFTWYSLFNRALHQCMKLQGFARASNGRLRVILTAADLERLLTDRNEGKQVTGGLLSLEGVHALEGRIDNLDRLYNIGLRMVGMTHFFDNEAGGSAHGMERGGLTEFGRQVVRRANEKHMILDLAHASPAMIDEVLALTTAPLVVSHTGVKGTHDSVRNLSDDHVKAVAANGGVMGMAMFDEAVGEASLAATARAARYVADLVGVDFVAVGGDLDGSVLAPVHVGGMPLLTEALLAEGFHDEDIGKILGLNAFRVLKAVLPSA